MALASYMVQNLIYYTSIFTGLRFIVIEENSMGSRIAFACLGKPILLVYERFSDTGSIHPIVCFDKTSKTLIPFEKDNFDDLQSVLDHVCWLLTSSQVKAFLETLEVSTLSAMNKPPDFQN